MERKEKRPYFRHRQDIYDDWEGWLNNVFKRAGRHLEPIEWIDILGEYPSEEEWKEGKRKGVKNRHE